VKELKQLDARGYVEVGSLSFFVNLAPAAHGLPDFERLVTREVEIAFRQSLGASDLGNEIEIAYTESRHGCVIVTIGLAVASSVVVEFLRRFTSYRNRLDAAARRLNGRPVLPDQGGRSVWLYREDLDCAKARIHANNVFIVQNAQVGDTYHVAQAGAVGPNAHASHNVFQQVWQQAQGSVDLPALTGELERLRSELQIRARHPEQLVAAGKIAAAEIEAKKGGGAKMLEHLMEAGAWAFDVARDIGVEIAASLIKKSLGIPD
jgi:hypothetical protein